MPAGFFVSLDESHHASPRYSIERMNHVIPIKHG